MLLLFVWDVSYLDVSSLRRLGMGRGGALAFCMGMDSGVYASPQVLSVWVD